VFQFSTEGVYTHIIILLLLLLLQVPAVPGLSVVDVTGCGNAFCGAFLAAWGNSSSLLEAAAWGCVAGGIMAEWRGVPVPPPAALHELAASRLSLVLQGASQETVPCAEKWDTPDTNLRRAVYRSDDTSGRTDGMTRAWLGKRASVNRKPGKPVFAGRCSALAGLHKYAMLLS
jgi:hypothetical protein